MFAIGTNKANNWIW